MDSFADLHRHLDGSLRDSTLRELALEHHVPLPKDLRFRAGMGLDEALSRFKVTVAVLQTPAALRRVASEICEDADASGVSTLEIRFAPQLHGDIETAIEAVLEGIEGRAGLILCALYGEPPTFVEGLVRIALAHPGVVAIDLAGAPSAAHEWQLKDYATAFALARDLGLGRTVHAGEGRPPNEIRVAVEELGAERIGHGTTLLDDPRVLDLVLERQVTIEACPTSNVHTGAIMSFDRHPLVKWMSHGVRVCVCTDNTLLSDITSIEEHANVRALPGMTDEMFSKVVAHGHGAAFPKR